MAPPGTPAPKFVAEQLSLFSEDEGAASWVQLSHELVGLLSDQLYQSPLKAIEELVVNSYDADATECRLHVPPPSAATAPDAFIAVFDSGVGMDREGLIDLWHIGHSRKRDSDMAARLKRKSIGKFGIGKLATYSVGRRLTYLSKTKDAGLLGVTVDFSRFDTAPRGTPVKVALPIHRLKKWASFQKTDLVKRVIESLDLDDATLKGPHWTLAIIEDLKPKAAGIRIGTLKWVLSTALPLGTDFHLYLNKQQIKSSKEKSKKVVEFNMSDLPSRRVEELKKETSAEWKIDDEGKLVTPEFPNGISAHVVVTEESLYGQKSEDIMRSHGYFIKVRGRLINQDDPYFGVFPKTYEIWNNFRATVVADDLDEVMMSSREQIEDSVKRKHLQEVLHQLFNEARSLFKVAKDKRDAAQLTKKEDERDFVGARLVEEPMADVLSRPATGDALDDEWFYLHLDDKVDKGTVVQRLYTQPRGRYSFTYERHGKDAHLFRFDPAESSFTINDQHEFVEEHSEDPRARILLEDMVTAELMLEIYLRRSGVRGHIIADVLSSRDTLLRSLSKERRFSLLAIAQSLRDAAANEHDLEVALVYAARALGFVAKHISGAGQPDGLATFIDYPDGEKRITLEAKSSAKTPSLGAMTWRDSNHTRQHTRRTGAL